MKKLIILLVLMSVAVWGSYPFSQKTKEEVVTLSQNVDLMIEGEVISVEQYYIHKDERILLELEEITDETLGKVRTYTKLSVKVTENFKDQENLLNDDYTSYSSYESRTGYSVVYNPEEEFYKYLYIEE